MTNEIIFPHDTPALTSLYAVILNNVGQIYNGATFEAITDANWGNYDIPLTEGGTASQIYLGTFPVIAAGVYTIIVYDGAAPAVGDTLKGAGKIDWGGTAEWSLADVIPSDPRILIDTTIATLASQNLFTLTAGSADDDAYLGQMLICIDQSTATQIEVKEISNYVGSTRTVTLQGSASIFTKAVGDRVIIVAQGDGEAHYGQFGLTADYYNNGFVTIDSSAIPTANENADALLKRDWTAVTGEAARSVLNALRFLRNKWSVSGSTLTVTEEDDATPAWTGTVTTDAAADPITGVDP